MVTKLRFGMVFGLAKAAPLLLLMTHARVAADDESANPGRPWPVAVELADVRMTGELSKRLTASFDRLEEGFYSPPGLYDSPNAGWPGDKEGRTLLGLVLLEQVAVRQAPTRFGPAGYRIDPSAENDFIEAVIEPAGENGTRGDRHPPASSGEYVRLHPSAEPIMVRAEY